MPGALASFPFGGLFPLDRSAFFVGELRTVVRRRLAARLLALCPGGLRLVFVGGPDPVGECHAAAAGAAVGVALSCVCARTPTGVLMCVTA